MKKHLKILSIDGTRGTGKTSQINILSRFFKSIGLNVILVKAGEDISSDLSVLEFIEKALNTEQNSIILMKGSVARPMVADLIKGIGSSEVIDKYKHVMHKYETLNQKYGVLGILLVMDDLAEANRRIEKKQALTGQLKTGVINLAEEGDIVSGMKAFNNHIASKSIVFKAFDLEPNDNIMNVNRNILKYLEETYDFPNPVKNPDDW